MYPFLLKPLWRQALHMLNSLLEEAQACCFLHVGNTCRACFANKSVFELIVVGCDASSDVT